MKHDFEDPNHGCGWARRWLAGAAVLILAASAALAQTDPMPAGGSAPADSVASTLDPDTSAIGVDASPVAAAPTPDSLSAPRAAAAPNARLVGVRKVRLARKPENVARSGPGDQYSIVGVYPKGATFVVIAKSGDWYNLRLSDSQTGWIHASLCKEFDDLSDLEFHPNPRLYSRTGTYTLCGYGGAYAFDRKSNTLVLGGRLGYYVFDRIQAEAGLAWTHVHRPAEIVESLFDLSLEAEDFHMLFYNLNLTWEILPGRQMVPFLGAGVGSAIMQGDTEATFNFGAGTTLFLSKRLAMRWECRDYRFKSGPKGARFGNNNVELTLGTVYLF
jgi:outer membrane beta-barrel protein